jgi:ankyrin repeat protein
MANMTNQDLLEAVQEGNPDKVRAALVEGLDPNYCDDESYWTLLHWASQEGYVEIIKLLVEFGADVEGCFNDDMTALFNAAGHGNLDVVKTLVECGANVNKAQKAGTALHNASAYGHAQIVEFLIDRGADIKAVDEDGVSALQFALSNAHDEVADLLIAKGAQKYVVDKDRMPHQIAISNAVLARYDSCGFENLNNAEQILACVLLLKFEVESHGFDGYYSSPVERYATETLRALESIGAVHSAQLLQQANACFEHGSLLENREARVSQLLRDDSIRERLDDITSEFYADKDDLRGLVDRFIENNHDQLPKL